MTETKECCPQFDPHPWDKVTHEWKDKLFITDTTSADVIKMTGTYISRVFDGPYSGVPTYITEMEEYLKTLAKKSKKYYFYFTTCPKCAKKFGHNYIVAVSEV